MATNLRISSDKWYWCDLATRTIDLYHGWDYAAVCEIENDAENSMGFAVLGKDVFKNAVSVVQYTAKRDGVTRELVVDTPIKSPGDGWLIGSRPSTRLDVFGQKVVFVLCPEPTK